MARYLYLPIEEAAREMRARLLLAQQALERGFTVHIGQQWLLSANLDRFPPGVVLVKGNNRAQARMMRSARQAGHVVASIEEEALGLADEREILRLYDPETPNLCDLVLAQGEFQKACLERRFPELRGRVDVVGNARADLLDRRFIADVLEEAARLRQEHGPYVLVNTNFAAINPREGDTLTVFRLCADVGILDPTQADDLEYFRAWCRWERANIQTVLATIRAVLNRGPQTAIIVRPHPSENLKPWVRAAAPVAGVDIRREGDHLAWTLGSELLVQASCTTGLEAFLLDHPVISLTPGEDPWHEFFAVNHCTSRVDSAGQAAEAVARVISGDRSGLAERADALERLRPHLLIDGKSTATRRTIDALTRIAPEPNDAAAPHPVLREVVQRQRHVVKAFVDLAQFRQRFDTIAKSFGRTMPTKIQKVGPSLFRLEAQL